MAEELVILGAGGSGADIAWSVEAINRSSQRWILRGFLDDDAARHGGSVGGYPILGPLALVHELPEARLLVGMAHYRRPFVRRDVVERLRLPAERYATLVDPSAAVSPHAVLGAGTLVLHQAIVCSGATLGAHAYIGHQSLVSHDVVVEDYATLAAGAVLCGSARLETGAYAGARSVIRDGVVVGAGAVAGLGSAVFRDVPAGSTVVGNPARLLPVTSPRGRA